MKVYIAGKITDNPDYMKQFAEAERALKQAGYTVMNPTILPEGFEHHEYMKVCFSMIDVCKTVYMLNNWRDSKGAKMEHDWALSKSKAVIYQREVCK